MKEHPYVSVERGGMKTYIFKVVVEPDDDKWSAYCPALLPQGATTWGNTQEEALKHINEVVQLIVQELLEDGEPVPEDVLVSQDPLVSITV
jgi:predicted RNase H-like HicB family nuclease